MKLPGEETPWLLWYFRPDILSFQLCHDYKPRDMTITNIIRQQHHNYTIGQANKAFVLVPRPSMPRAMPGMPAEN